MACAAARVGARIDARRWPPYGREVDTNTTINLPTSGDQCWNAFLIGFDGVGEAAVFGAAREAPRQSRPGSAPA